MIRVDERDDRSCVEEMKSFVEENEVKSLFPKPVGVTRSTSPIDERIIRLLLGQRVHFATDVNPDSYPTDSQVKMGYEFEREKVKETKQLDPPLIQEKISAMKREESVESVMTSMARVMEAVESIVRNGNEKVDMVKKPKKIVKKKGISTRSTPSNIEGRNDEKRSESEQGKPLKSKTSNSPSIKKSQVMDLILAKIQVSQII